ncbi:CHAT domain-containing protein [Streptomyces sp. NPDC057616]|uniref:CHAT domain-containing protein n=1 Tax=Streptomyces sp. NPDC057616 TaxID=3346183 RepID=UPI0036942B88
MSGGAREAGTVFDDFFAGAGAGQDEFVTLHLGEDSLTLPFMVEPVFLIPTSFLHDLGVGSTLSFDLVFAAAWEAVDPLGRYGPTPAFGAQVLAALGGNPQRADADSRRHLRLALTALGTFRGKGLRRHEGRAYLELGRALERCRRNPDALTAYERGRALLEDEGDRHGLRAAHARLALVMGSIGLYEQSLLHAEAGQRIGRGLPPAETAGRADAAGRAETAGRPALGHAHITATLHFRRVRALMRIGFLDEAESALEDWRQDPDAAPDRYELLATTGELRLLQDRSAEAVEVLTDAVDARFADAATASLPVRTHYLENSVELFGKATGAALHLGRPELAAGLLAAMTGRRPRRPEGPAPAALRPLDQEIHALALRATRAAVAGDAGMLTVHDDRARILLEARDALLHGPQDSGERTPLTVAELTRAIPRAVGPGELALAYARSSQNELVVLAVADGTVVSRTAELPADRLEKLVAPALEECLSRSGPAAVHRLGEALLAPVADLLAGASRVFVTAQGPLADFPFHAAPFRGRPLVHHAEVRSLPSLGLLASAGAGTRPARPRRPGAPRAVFAAVEHPAYELLPPLTMLRTEAEAVRTAFPAAGVLHDERATASAVLDAVVSCDVLHLAGHAAFAAEHPNMARILLADRPLFAFEVAAAPAAPRLVNLSGCRAGAERRHLGGEGEGLAASFLAAGTEIVVAPPWPVRDDAALAFNSVLYGELARPGREVGEAVRSAQLALLADPRFAHPGLWGAFTVLGGL